MRRPRRVGVVALVVIGWTLTACSSRAGDASEANCPIVERELFVLMAQSVPTATLLPCIEALPAGWTYGGSDVRNGIATFWLDSDRGGLHSVQVSLTSSCRTAGSVDVTNSTSEAGVRVFLHEFTLHPFSANKYFLFPGGCVTYRISFGPKAEPTLALEADEALAFGFRTVLVQKIQQDIGLTLCGAGAPSCVGGD